MPTKDATKEGNPVVRRGTNAIRFVLEVVQLYFDRRVSRAAAGLAYFLILSFFPALICLNAVIGTLNLDVAKLLQEAELIIPKDALAVLTDYVHYITIHQSRALLIAGVSTMLMSASAALRILMGVIDDIYGWKPYTGLWRIVASISFSVLFLVLIYASLIVLLTGSWFFRLLERLLSSIPRLQDIHLPWEWQWIRFLVLFCMVLFFVMLAYRSAVPRGVPRPPILTGALLASVALVAVSVLFSAFIGYSSRYSLVYGSLASVMILMVWLYLCGTIVILGAIVNRVWYGWKTQQK